MSDVEAGGPTTAHSEAGRQTATPGGPTASRSRVVARPCAPPAGVVVEVIVVVPSSAHAYLYALLQYGEDTRHMTTTSRCSARCWRRTVSPHCR
jgi:hypothetical protein